MREWTGVGIAVALVVLVGAVAVAFVGARGGGDEDDALDTEAFDDLTTRVARGEITVVVSEDLFDDDGVRGEGVLRVTPPPTRVDPESAESDDDPSLPGTFVGSQGRGHFDGGLVGHAMTPFCADVRAAEGRDTTTEVKTVGPVNRCYESNPPSSGRHLGVQRNVDIGGGRIINIPPDPDVYPHDIEIPRDAIPHILEHAGVFVGHHCVEGDAECEVFVMRIEDLVNQMIDEGDRVVMARDTDLPVGEIGVAAWTRVLNVRWDEAELDDIEEFISVHSCRFDPEGFCG